jgi:hypothetical protein
VHQLVKYQVVMFILLVVLLVVNQATLAEHQV